MAKVIKNNWLRIASLIAAGGVLLYVFGCQPTTKSMLDSTQQINRTELQLELEIIQRTFEQRSQDLADKQQLRNLIAQNALLLAEPGGINPLSIITGLLAVYGGGTAVRDTKKAISKRTKK